MCVVGATRLPQSVPLNEGGQNDSRPILILGEMHNPMHMIGFCLETLKHSTLKVVLRPHPSTHSKVKREIETLQHVSKLHVEIDNPKVSLAETLLQWRPLVVIAGATGAAVEVALSRWPVALISTNWLPNISVFAASEIPRIISSKTELVEFLDKMNTDTQFYNTYSAACQESAQYVIFQQGEDAYRTLKQGFG